MAGRPSEAAVAFSLSNSTLPNTYNGVLNLQITGLNAGETVQIDHVLDVNVNGIADASDWLAESARVTDGQAMTIGSVVNINVPRDSDSTSGSITIPLDFNLLPFEQKINGSHLFTLSSPSARFAPITVPLAITVPAYAQSIRGSVTVSGSGSPVPFASIVPLVPSGDGNNPVPGTIADASGHYSLQTPVGTYFIAAFKPGFVTNFRSLPQANLTAGANISANVALIPSDRNITGRIVDSATSQGLPGLLVTAQSESGGFALAQSDSTGAYTLNVISGNWKVSLSDVPLARRGYLRPDKFHIDTTGGSVANINFPVVEATALIYGRVTDGLNTPLAGLSLWDEIQTGSLEASGLTDANGNYVLAATAGTWYTGFDFTPAIVGYIAPSFDGLSISSSAAVLRDVTLRSAPYMINGTLRDADTGQSIGGVEIRADANLSGVNYSTKANTQGDGSFTNQVSNGMWTVSVNCGDLGDSGYECPSGQTVVVSGSNKTVNFSVRKTAPPAPPKIPPTSLPVALVQKPYSQSILVDGSVVNWSISSGALPPGLNLFQDGSISGSATQAGVFDFTLTVSNRGGQDSQALSITVLASSGWTYKPFMPTARAGAGAAAINGKLYIVGGYDSMLGTFDNLESYDPSSGKWQALASLPISRGNLGACELGGKLYVAGGSGGFNSETAFEMFDPASGQWTTLPSLQASCSGCAAVVVDGKIYVLGGSSDPTRSLEIYDPVGRTWTYGDPVPTARYGLAAAAVNGKIYAIGGASTTTGLGVVEMYDPATDSWFHRGTMPVGFSAWGVSAAAQNGKILVAGGSGFAMYDPASDQWSVLPNFPTARSGAAAAVIGDNFFLAGGEANNRFVPTLEQFRTTQGDPIVTQVIVSDSAVQGAGIGFGVPSPAKFDRLNNGATTGLTFASTLPGANGSSISQPAGAPKGTEVISIPPGDGQNGFFKLKFILPQAYLYPELSFASSADDMSRVFVNGTAVTAVMAQSINYSDVFFSVSNEALFHPGENEILIANANYFGGASAVSFYGFVTYRPVFAITTFSRSEPNQFQFTVALDPGKNYSVEYSLDLKTWTPLTNGTAITTAVSVTDSAASDSRRFYRVSTQQ